MVKAVRALGMETCATLGMLKEGQAGQLKAAGLDYYNHNLDTSPEFYGEIIPKGGFKGDLLLARIRWTEPNKLVGDVDRQGSQTLSADK